MSDKKYKNESREAQKSRDVLLPLFERTALPESLSKEKIEKLLINATENTVPNKKNGAVKRFVALAAAAAVFVLCGIGFAGVISGSFAPSVAVTEAGSAEVGVEKIPIANESGSNTATTSNSSDYSLILSFINSYKSKLLQSDIYLHEILDESSEGVVFSSPYSSDCRQPSSSVKGDGWIGEDIYGKTNLQVDGIDEADIIKTDGKYIYESVFDYSVDGSVVKIIIADAAPENMSVVSEIIFAQNSSYNDRNLCNFYVRGDTLIAIFTDCLSGKIRTGYAVYDISDKKKPVEVDYFYQDGSCISSRITDGNLILISSTSLNYGYIEDLETYSYAAENASEQSRDGETAAAQPALTASDVIPATYNGGYAGVMIPADRIYVKNECNPNSFTVVTSTSLDDLTATPEVYSILGDNSEVYCSSGRLYVFGSFFCDFAVNTDGSTVSSRAFIPAETVTAQNRISVFDITDGGVEFIGDCCIRGRILNSYSADEYNGYFRVASCENNKSYITVFNSELQQVGVTPAFGEDEDLKSVRFMGNTAYAVTFLQTDPLFVINLSSPENPFIEGEVEIPGFSSYLHPAGDGLIIGIGSGGNENGMDGSAKISLFDISDPKRPVELSSLVYENAWFNCDSHAFVSVVDGSFIIPLVTSGAYVVGDYAESDYIPGILRFGIENGRLVEMNYYQNTGNDSVEDNAWEFYRGTYIGGTVYLVSCSSVGIDSYDMQSGDLLGQLR